VGVVVEEEEEEEEEEEAAAEQQRVARAASRRPFHYTFSVPFFTISQRRSPKSAHPTG
jgi:hypothetical protein